jgi:hypothetical protein
MSTGRSDLATLDNAFGTEVPLPRDNGELVFEEPWQGRALGIGVVAIDRAGASWAVFRRHLAAAIAARASGEGEGGGDGDGDGDGDGESHATAYYAAWLAAVEALLAERGLLE